MKILVRLPNWLGDMVMSVGFLHALPHFFPDAQVSVVAKKGIHELLSFFPSTEHQFVFDKQQYKGVKGSLKYGRQIRETEDFDLFFTLPDSFSAAMMGIASGAKKRVGYKNELRNVLLTDAYKKTEGLHRVEEYMELLQLYTGMEGIRANVSLHHSFAREEYMVLNINSEASSRRLTPAKAAEILIALRNSSDRTIVLIGAPKEKEFVAGVILAAGNPANVENAAGTTSLTELTALLGSARVVLTTDSGPAHLANALGTQTVVLFGAGNEKNTAPYNKENRTVIRLGELTCEPCQKNVCVRYDVPQCLERLNTVWIAQTVKLYSE